ncbi:Hypothetical predicted protein, partial [Paramuricea clavata]
QHPKNNLDPSMLKKHKTYQSKILTFHTVGSVRNFSRCIYYRYYRNRVNRERKKCREKFYSLKVEHLKKSKPSRWWKEVKQIAGMTPSTGAEDLYNQIHIDDFDRKSPNEIANLINTAFLDPMKTYQPLTSLSSYDPNDSVLHLDEFDVYKGLASLNPRKASALSKVAEEFVVSKYIGPAILCQIDPNQFGVIPKSSTSMAAISMIHNWSQSTDGTGAAVRVALFDYKKAFDLIDHCILADKISRLPIPKAVVRWTIDFLLDRKQRVKLATDCVSEWGAVPAGVPQGTKLGPWLFLWMINDLKITEVSTWKYVDDTTVSEVVKKGDTSKAQDAVTTINASPSLLSGPFWNIVPRFSITQSHPSYAKKCVTNFSQILLTIRHTNCIIYCLPNMSRFTNLGTIDSLNDSKLIQKDLKKLLFLCLLSSCKEVKTITTKNNNQNKTRVGI